MSGGPGTYARLGTLGGQIQMSSPLGQALITIARQYDIGATTDTNLEALVLRTASQVQLSSPLGQLLLRWAKGLHDGTSTIIPSLVAQANGVRSGQTGASPLGEFLIDATADGNAY